MIKMPQPFVDDQTDYRASFFVIINFFFCWGQVCITLSNDSKNELPSLAWLFNGCNGQDIDKSSILSYRKALKYRYFARKMSTKLKNFYIFVFLCSKWLSFPFLISDFWFKLLFRPSKNRPLLLQSRFEVVVLSDCTHKKFQSS